MLPVRSRKTGLASNSAASRIDLVSFQRIAGARGTPLRSRTVAPCICPERPIPDTARDTDRGAFALKTSNACSVAASQS